MCLLRVVISGEFVVSCVYFCLSHSDMVSSLETYISLLDLDNVTALHCSQVDNVFLKLPNGGGRDRVTWRAFSLCIWGCVCLGL